jgi:hypothetical protein
MAPSELSQGFFSASNQKKLLGQDSDIPVFEAKMERDTRLVYTIDCVMDASGKVGSDPEPTHSKLTTSYSMRRKVFDSSSRLRGAESLQCSSCLGFSPMLSSIGTFGKQLAITFRDVDLIIERGNSIGAEVVFRITNSTWKMHGPANIPEI